ncbi:MAG: hypothetical protein R6U52_11285 [Kosmotogaceae bacterium]
MDNKKRKFTLEFRLTLRRKKQARQKFTPGPMSGKYVIVNDLLKTGFNLVGCSGLGYLFIHQP